MKKNVTSSIKSRCQYGMTYLLTRSMLRLLTESLHSLQFIVILYNLYVVISFIDYCSKYKFHLFFVKEGTNNSQSIDYQH